MNPAPPTLTSSPPADALRARATNAAASLIALYLASQPRDLRRSILTAGKVAGWHLDRSTAVDLVASLDDATLRYVLARLYDWSEAALAEDATAIDVAVDDPAEVERAHRQLAATLNRSRW